jgi:hypothetical protein
MGAMQNHGRNPKKSSKSGRGSVKNTSRLDAFAQQSGKGSADWGTVDARWLQAVVVEITGMGGAVTIGLSRDEGAHSLTLLLDGTRETLWFNGNADLTEELKAVHATLEGMH